ncbi:DUF2905 domain-containing protein, partial [Mesorhizobium sp. M5C.F.Ca.IN.020.32.2.1]
GHPASRDADNETPKMNEKEAAEIERNEMSRTLIVIGLIIVATGLLWPWLSRIGLGRLPGDIVIERENFTFYAPIGTGILISIVLSFVLWLLNR